MLERASLLFSRRGTDLQAYIYGTLATADARKEVWTLLRTDWRSAVAHFRLCRGRLNRQAAPGGVESARAGPCHRASHQCGRRALAPPCRCCGSLCADVPPAKAGETHQQTQGQQRRELECDILRMRRPAVQLLLRPSAMRLLPPLWLMCSSAARRGTGKRGKGDGNDESNDEVFIVRSPARQHSQCGC
jgi:hypothetical protein